METAVGICIYVFQTFPRKIFISGIAVCCKAICSICKSKLLYALANEKTTTKFWIRVCYQGKEDPNKCSCC